LCAIVGGVIARKFRQPAVFGLLLIGALIGPNALNLVQDMDMIRFMAELGAILMLFTIGLEFDLSKLVKEKGPLPIHQACDYIRQVALLAVMAQMGSFVPAKRMRLGLTDRIFTRVGAADDLARGASTFMVEMNETANILHHATSRSLVILDEVGRGTSTFDGISIAWAVTEHLHDKVGARTLFATHYHELTELASVLPRVRNLQVAVREWGDSIVFLHQIVEGATDRSYGIQVARLAGIPRDVVERAKEILGGLEGLTLGAGDRPKMARAPARGEIQQLTLFDRSKEIPPPPPEGDPLREELRALDPDRITPLEALRALTEWKERFAPRP